MSNKSRPKRHSGKRGSARKSGPALGARPRPPIPGMLTVGGDDEISQIMHFLKSQPQLIVCGRLGLKPLSEPFSACR